ncbi:MAG: nucleotidyltransferase domain-containing protein [Thermodesulfobacteriota bacterium]|nr:nucleotidyltransferase domain-containing protein [Thermodesulfobacteriota bacterium]
MILTKEQKDELKKELVLCLGSDEKIKKIVVFGSFINSNDPVDLDVAVFQESNEPYLPLAMKYRKKTRSIGDKIPIDIFPVRPGAKDHSFLSEIAQGEVVYER